MQEKRDTDSRATPWTLYFFEEGGWVLIESFGSEEEARASTDALRARSEVPPDYFALVGPEDKVMPLAPTSAVDKGPNVT